MRKIIYLCLALCFYSAVSADDVSVKFLPAIKEFTHKLHFDTITEIDKDLTILSYKDTTQVATDMRLILGGLEAKFNADETFLLGHSQTSDDKMSVITIDASTTKTNITEYLLVKAVTLDGHPKIMIVDILRIIR